MGGKAWWIVPALLLALLRPVEAEAQRRPAERFFEAPASGTVTLPAPPDPEVAPTVTMVLGGVLLGAGGLFLGGAAGAYLACGRSGGDYCGIAGAVLGGLVGESLGIPLGVHLANGRRGSYAVGALASIGAGAVMLTLLALGEDDGGDAGPMYLTIPVAQLVAAVQTEQATSRPR